MLGQLRGKKPYTSSSAAIKNKAVCNLIPIASTLCLFRSVTNFSTTANSFKLYGITLLLPAVVTGISFFETYQVPNSFFNFILPP